MPKMRNNFKESYSFESRRKLGEKFRKNFPGKIPVIVQRSFASRVGSDETKKYIMPGGLTFGHLYYLVRSYLNLRPQEAVILYVKDVIPASASTLMAIYEAYHDDDYFLYVAYQDESVYGGCSDLPSGGKSGNSSNEGGEEDDGQENQGNPPAAGPNPETGENVNEPLNGNPIPIIQVHPPEGNGSAAATGIASEGAYGMAGPSGNNSSRPLAPYYQILANNTSFSRLVSEFFIANRRLLHAANGVVHSRASRFSPIEPQPNVTRGAPDRPPLQDISGAMSNVNVSFGDELELAVGDSSGESISGEEIVTAAREPDVDDAVGRPIGDADVTAGGPGEDAEAAVRGPVGDHVAVGGLIGDADAATGGPTWDVDTAVGEPLGDVDVSEGSPNRDNDSGAGSFGGDGSYGIGSIGEAFATDTTGENDDSGGVDALGEGDATGDNVSSAGSSVGEMSGEDSLADDPTGEEGHDGGNAVDDDCGITVQGSEGK